jgi:hypothetical protein
MASDTRLMEKVVLYGAIGLVILFVLLLLMLALARPIQAAPHRCGAFVTAKTHKRNANKTRFLVHQVSNTRC